MFTADINLKHAIMIGVIEPVHCYVVDVGKSDFQLFNADNSVDNSMEARDAVWAVAVETGRDDIEGCVGPIFWFDYHLVIGTPKFQCAVYAIFCNFAPLLINTRQWVRVQ